MAGDDGVERVGLIVLTGVYTGMRGGGGEKRLGGRHLVAGMAKG